MGKYEILEPEKMKKKKKTTRNNKITIADYIKTIKKVDREIELESNVGWKSITKVHKSKKLYDRKKNKKDYSEE